MQLDGRAAVTIHDAVELVNSFPRPHIALLDVDIGGTAVFRVSTIVEALRQEIRRHPDNMPGRMPPPNKEHAFMLYVHWHASHRIEPVR
jgi:hypothetical protein